MALLIVVAAGSASAEPEPEPVATSDEAETRALIAADSYVATDPDGTTVVADVAWAAHLEWRTRQRKVVGDYVQRESLIGTPPRRELHELSYVDRSLEPFTFTVGRFRVPGGFWLIADGGSVAVRQGTFEAAVYGGARSFTNGRSETLLTGSPTFLPLGGAALTLRGDVQARLAYTYTRDVVVVPGSGFTQPPAQPDQYLDVEVVAQLSDRVMLVAAATAGTRYLVTYPSAAMQLTDDPRLQTMWFGSQSAYSVLDMRAGDWRLSTSLAATRTKLGQVPETAAAAAINGSFVESSNRALWRRGRTWRTTLRYRARVFGDRRHAHRAYASGEWRPGIIDVKVAAGADIHAGAVAGSGFVDSRTLLYRASAGVKSAWAEANVGVAAVSSIGDEIAITPGLDATDSRNPYTLEARSYVFAHAFATRGAWFSGIDVEIDLAGKGLRALAQLGWAR